MDAAAGTIQGGIAMKMKDYERENADIARKLREEDERERIQNPLLVYSTTQLKAELRRRKREGK